MSAIRNTILDKGMDVLEFASPSLLRLRLFRQVIVNIVESVLIDRLPDCDAANDYPPEVDEARAIVKLSLLQILVQTLTDHPTSTIARCSFLKVLVRQIMNIPNGRIATNWSATGCNAVVPIFIGISLQNITSIPSADKPSGTRLLVERLNYAAFDRVVSEAKSLWGTRYFVIDGDEPLTYRSDDKGVLDIVRKHPDCFFVIFTSGALIDAELAARLKHLGNLSLVFTLEGWRERTDACRGAGVFSQELIAMDYLRTYGIPFGVALAVTRDNLDEILSDEFVDFCFEHMGARYGFISQYQPIDDSALQDLPSTDRQSQKLWRRTWEIIRERRIFLTDVWGHNALSLGCIAAGTGKGGYLYVNWNGTVSHAKEYPPAAMPTTYSKKKII